MVLTAAQRRRRANNRAAQRLRRQSLQAQARAQVGPKAYEEAVHVVQQHPGRKRPSAPVTPFAKERAVHLVTQEQIEEDLYLHGLIDPRYGSRGPAGRADAPTVLVRMEQSYTIQLNDYDATHGTYDDTGTARWSGTGWDLAQPQYAVDSIKGIALCIQHTPYVYFGETNPNAWHSGFTMGTQRLMKEPLSDLNAGPDPNVISSPLPQTPWPMPGLMRVDAATVGNDGVIEHEMPYRCVGLQAEMTINQPALDAQGEVYGGSNQDFQVVENRRLYDQSTASQTRVEPMNAALYSADAATANDSFQYLSNFRYINPLGSVTNGAKYTVNWIPINDRGLDYIQSSTSVPFKQNSDAVDYTGEGCVSALTQLINNPTCIFVLQALNFANSKPTLTIGVTAMYEVPVKVTNSVGWLIASARLARRYMVDWGMIANGAHGGRSHHMLKENANNRVVMHARAIALGHVPAPALRAPAISSGVTPSTTTDHGSLASRVSRDMYRATRTVVADTGQALSFVGREAENLARGLQFLPAAMRYIRGAAGTAERAAVAAEEMAPLLLAAP